MQRPGHEREHAGERDAWPGSPAARGTTEVAISGASDESGPKDQVRLGPNNA